jgi:hypothetical protein
MKIWIVFGTTGEYSDRNEWVVDAWNSKKAAEKRVKELTIKLQKSGIAIMPRGNIKEKAIEQFKIEDPHFAFDYTGTF